MMLNLMKNSIAKNGASNETGRIEAFSDGVFAIAITLLILEIKVPDSKELQSGLLHALLDKWPSYLSFFIGFFTVLVCWINHHYLFNRIHTASHSLILFNSLTLFTVTFVPFPTAVLAASFREGDLQIAVQLFGIAYIVMSSCYRILSSFVYDKADQPMTNEERKYKKAIKTMYVLAIIHTTITFIITFYSALACLFMYTLLFSMFLFPDWYTNLIMKWQNRKTDNW